MPRDGCYFVTVTFAECLETDVLRDCGICRVSFLIFMKYMIRYGCLVCHAPIVTNHFDFLSISMILNVAYTSTKLNPLYNGECRRYNYIQFKIDITKICRNKFKAYSRTLFLLAVIYHNYAIIINETLRNSNTTLLH